MWRVQHGVQASLRQHQLHALYSRTQIAMNNSLCWQEGTVSAFSQWRAAASNSDLAGFLADTALVRGSLANISKQQTAAAQLAKAIADRTEAGTGLDVQRSNLH